MKTMRWRFIVTTKYFKSDFKEKLKLCNMAIDGFSQIDTLKQ